MLLCRHAGKLHLRNPHAAGAHDGAHSVGRTGAWCILQCSMNSMRLFGLMFRREDDTATIKKVLHFANQLGFEVYRLKVRQSNKAYAC